LLWAGLLAMDGGVNDGASLARAEQ
jgi:hypothetical protein